MGILSVSFFFLTLLNALEYVAKLREQGKRIFETLGTSNYSVLNESAQKIWAIPLNTTIEMT